jgi:hypothetical protein
MLDNTRLLPQCFSPDGIRLVTVSQGGSSIHVWDLRAIHRQLAERGLDGDLPPYPPPAANTPPFEIHLHLGEFEER